MEESAVGDSQGNGLAEHAVREVKAKVRTVCLQTKELHGTEIKADHPCLPWLVEYAAMSINVGRRGPDGRTAWELRHGRPWKRLMAPFSERVLYLPGGKGASRLEQRYRPGLFMGVLPRSDEVLIATEHGIVRARSFRRLPPEQRGDAEALNAIRGTPWRPVPSEPQEGGEIPVAISVEARPVVPAERLPTATAESAGRGATRQVYLRRARELRKFGYTPGCAGGAAAAAGTAPVAHSEACRSRITAAMRGDVADSARRRRRDARSQ